MPTDEFKHFAPGQRIWYINDRGDRREGIFVRTDNRHRPNCVWAYWGGTSYETYVDADKYQLGPCDEGVGVRWRVVSSDGRSTFQRVPPDVKGRDLLRACCPGRMWDSHSGSESIVHGRDGPWTVTCLRLE